MSHRDLQETRERFLHDVRNHSVEVECDEGVHRSVKFSHNNSSIYQFRLNTWPGYLSISGDMGTFVFCRTHDMFEFFRKDDLDINPHYWHEKLQSECSRDGAKEYDPDLAADTVQRLVKEGYIDPEEHADIIRDEFETTAPEFEHEAYDLLWQMLDDVEDINLKRFTLSYLWCLFAIVWGIQQYDQFKAKEETE